MLEGDNKEDKEENSITFWKVVVVLEGGADITEGTMQTRLPFLLMMLRWTRTPED